MTVIGNKKVFAKNLNRYMQINNKSRNDICEALGFKYSTFSEWATGKKYPRMDKVEMLANYFGVLKSDLIEDKSIQDHIEESPKEMAQLHFEMIMDEDLMEIFQDFKKLTPEAKQMAKKIIHSMVDEEV